MTYILGMLSTADKGVDDIVTYILGMLSTTDEGVNDILCMLSTADEDVDDILGMQFTAVWMTYWVGMLSTSNVDEDVNGILATDVMMRVCYPVQ